jgi:hypothetical protein
MNNNHETQPDKEPIVNNGQVVVNEWMQEIQIIEGGGPPKKVDWNSMPKPVRYFGYFYVGCIILMGVFVIVAALLNKA